MRKHLISGCVVAAFLALTEGGYAAVSMDAFDSYPVNALLSAATVWNNGSTSGALTIASLTGPSVNTNAATNEVVRVDTGTTTKATTYSGWGGPSGNTTAGPELNRNYFSVDVFKGTGASVTSPLWQVLFHGGSNPKNFLEIQGTLTSVQMIVLNAATVLYTGPLLPLQNGWNNICVMYNSAGSNPNPDGSSSGKNVSMFMNTDFNPTTVLPLNAAVDSAQIAAGPLGGTTGGVDTVTATRFNSTAGTGSLYLDNIVVSNTMALGATFTGWPTEQASYNPAPEPTTLLLLAGVMPLVRRRQAA